MAIFSVNMLSKGSYATNFSSPRVVPSTNDIPLVTGDDSKSVLRPFRIHSPKGEPIGGGWIGAGVRVRIREGATVAYYWRCAAWYFRFMSYFLHSNLLVALITVVAP